jgi:hypothetical protein
MTHSGDVGTEIAPEVVEDPELAARLDDLLHRACGLARKRPYADGDGRGRGMERRELALPRDSTASARPPLSNPVVDRAADR